MCTRYTENVRLESNMTKLSITKRLFQAISGQLKPMNVVNLGHKLFDVYGWPSIASGSLLSLV